MTCRNFRDYLFRIQARPSTPLDKKIATCHNNARFKLIDTQMSDGNGDKQQSPQERKEISFLADHVFSQLNVMERQHPHLKVNPAYSAFKLAISEEADNPSADMEVLRSIYDEMMQALDLISAERNSVTVIGKGQHLRLQNFLPATFDGLVSSFKVVRGPEVVADGIESVAEEILFGAHEGGIDGVALRYRLQVKAQVFKLLIYDDFEKQRIVTAIKKLGDTETLRLLHLDDNALLAMVRSEESTIGNIAHIILAARDEIHHEHGRPSSMVHAQDHAGLEEINVAARRIAQPDRPHRHLRLAENTLQS